MRPGGRSLEAFMGKHRCDCTEASLGKVPTNMWSQKPEHFESAAVHPWPLVRGYPILTHCETCCTLIICICTSPFFVPEGVLGALQSQHHSGGFLQFTISCHMAQHLPAYFSFIA